jgi:hypothetical protein
MADHANTHTPANDMKHQGSPPTAGHIGFGRAAKGGPTHMVASLRKLADEAAACTRCDLYRRATATVVSRTPSSTSSGGER